MLKKLLQEIVACLDKEPEIPFNLHGKIRNLNTLAIELIAELEG